MLAAGEGTRLRPLTQLRPKPLCPVGAETLLDRALGHVSAAATGRIAVNAHHLAPMISDHLRRRWPAVHVSLEQREALGTAGAVGQLRDWIAGAPVLIVNGDAWYDADPIPPLLADWDGERPRLLVVEDDDRGDFGRFRFAGASLLPWSLAVTLAAEPCGLYERVWRAAERQGALDLVPFAGTFVDCGTPADYLRANLLSSGGAPVIGEGAVVEGVVERSVVWPGAPVAAGERLVDAIRPTAGVTVHVGAGGSARVPSP